MKLCCFFNYPSHYRYPIYERMGKELNCDFYFGDSIDYTIKPFDVNALTGFKRILNTCNLHFKSYVWHKGIFKLINNRYDAYIVTGTTTILANWLLIIYAKFARKKIYVWCHGLRDRATKKSTRIVQGCFYKSFNGILMYSTYYASNLIDIGCAPDNIYAIHNSLDHDKHLALRKIINPKPIYNEHFKNDDHNLIFIGRLTKEKSLDLLLYALKQLSIQGENYNLTFVGDGVERNKLERMTKELGLTERVWFYGACYDEILNSELIYNADLCVSPGNVGLTAIHTMVFGTPVVTHNNFSQQMPEFETIRRGKTGDFFEYRNIESLALVISNWFYQHDNDREKIRRNCYEEIDNNWTPDYQIKMLKKVLKIN